MFYYIDVRLLARYIQQVRYNFPDETVNFSVPYRKNNVAKVKSKAERDKNLSPF
jgi:hypothetical protein